MKAQFPYHPFGLKHALYDTGGKKDYQFDENDPEEIARPGFVTSIPYQYKYNGKELQDELGLGMYDYGWRNYHPALGRFFNPDPLAEEFYSLSPYNYVANDPVGLADLDGRDFRINIMRNKEGEITGIYFSATVYIKGDGASKERALELDNKFMNNFSGIKEVDGIRIGVSVSYVYNEDISQNDLGAGENILNFSATEESKKNRSHVEGYKLNGIKYTGNTGTIFGSGKNDNTVFHETFHFMGLSDRYDDFTGDKWRPVQNQTTVPHKGFENDIMGDSSNLILNKFHYKQWYDHAMKRSKGHGNQFGSEYMKSNSVVDVNSNGKLKTP